MVKSLSIEQAYMWAQRFVAREWRLVLPVAFTFIAFPSLAIALLAPDYEKAVLTSAMQTGQPVAFPPGMGTMLLIMPLLFLFSNIGGLAITALALVPGISVREALAIGIRRVGVLIGSQFLLVGAALIAILLLSFVAVLLKAAPAGAAALAALLILCAGLYVGMRLVLLMPMIVRRRVGPVSALRETWVATQGHVLRIVGAVLIYLVGATVVTVALSSALGSGLLLLGKAVGSPELGTALNAVLAQGLATLTVVGLHLIAVGLFRQVDGSSNGI